MISVRYFCLIKDLLCDFVWFNKKSNVHLLYSSIHVFIHNSITKYNWQNFAKPLAKAFRKNSIVLCGIIHLKKPRTKTQEKY